VEGFHTKGWTKIFIVDFVNFYGQNNNLKQPGKTPCHLFDKNRAGDFISRNSIYCADITGGGDITPSKQIFKSKRRMITTCDLHQKLIWPLEMIP
jgi:hypothetical protein